MSYIDRNGKYHYAGSYPEVSNPFDWEDDEYAGREFITDGDTMFFYYDGNLLGKCSADAAECSNLLELMRSDREVATGVLNYLNSFGDPVFPVSEKDWSIAETNVDNVDIYDLYTMLMQELDYQYSDTGSVYVDQIPGVEIWVSSNNQVMANTKRQGAAEESEDEDYIDDEDDFEEDDFEEDFDEDEGDYVDEDHGDRYLDDDERFDLEWNRSVKLHEQREAENDEDEEDDIEGSTNINAYFFAEDALRRNDKLSEKQAAELDEDEEDDITGDTKYFATMVNAGTSNSVRRLIRYIKNGDLLSISPELRQKLNSVSIKDFYLTEHSDDWLGEDLNDLTFADLFDILNYGEDVYDAIGVEDSMVRERLFDELSKLMNLDYDVIYSMWLYGQ